MFLNTLICLLEFSFGSKCNTSIYTYLLSALIYLIITSIIVLVWMFFVFALINCYYKNKQCVDCLHVHKNILNSNEKCGHILRSKKIFSNENIPKYNYLKNQCFLCKHNCHKNNPCTDKKRTIIGYKEEPYEYIDKIQVGINKIVTGQEKKKYIVDEKINKKDYTISTDIIDHYEKKTIKKNIFKEWKNVGRMIDCNNGCKSGKFNCDHCAGKGYILYNEYKKDEYKQLCYRCGSTRQIVCNKCKGLQRIMIYEKKEIYDQVDEVIDVPVYKTTTGSLIVSREPIYADKTVPTYRNEPIYKERKIMQMKKVEICNFTDCVCKMCFCVDCSYCACHKKQQQKYNYCCPLIKTFIKFHLMKVLFMYLFLLISELIYLSIIVFVLKVNQLFFLVIMTLVTLFFELFFLLRYSIYRKSIRSEIIEYKSFFPNYVSEYQSLT